MIPCKCVLRHFHMCTPAVNRLCVSRDVNKMHMAEGGVPDLGQSPRGLLRNFYFSGKMTTNFPYFFYSNDFNESSHHQNSKRSSLGLSYRNSPFKVSTL